MHSRISRDSILLWSTVVLIVGMALLQNKQYPLVINAALTLVLLVVAYWTLPRYRSVPFFLLLAPGAIVTAISSGLLSVDGFHWQSLFTAITVVMALGGIVIAWQLPRYELVVLPVVVGLFVTSMHVTATSGLWLQVVVIFTLAVLSIAALATARRLSM
jgi:hypothetical protein